MKKLHLFLLSTLVMLSASAQKQYFVYIQTETEQQFSVKINQKTLWSSPAGYIILPKLVDSTYTISVSFTQNKWPEQSFSLAVNKKDHGFLLKNFEDKGWGLFDMQSLQVQMALNAASESNSTNNNAVTPFAEILAKAADDPSLKENTARPKKEEVKTEVVAVVPTDTVSTAAVKTVPASTEETIPATSKKNTKKKKPKETELVTGEKPKVESTDVENKELAKNEVKNESKPEIKENNTAATEEKKEIKAETKPEVKETVAIPEEKKETKPETKTENKETVVPVEEKKEVKAEIKAEQKEPVAEVKKEETKPEVITEAPAEKYNPSQVKKYAESSTTEGFGLIYIDNYGNGVKDTIRLMIPNPKPVVTPVKEEPREEKKFLEISAEPKNNEGIKEVAEPVKQEKPVVKEEPKNPEEKPLSRKEKKAKKEEEKAVTQPDETVVKKEEIKPAETVTKPAEDNSIKNTAPVTGTGFTNSCVDLATEEEFVRLRKKMAGEKEDKMVAEAKKVFKTRCFSTSQVRTLGRLFETDEERYNFFDAAYRHVFNPEAYPALVSEFQDSYYTNRFKAMLR